MALSSVDWKPSARVSAVRFCKPDADNDSSSQRRPGYCRHQARLSLTIDARYRSILGCAKSIGQEHMQARNGNAFATLIHLVCMRLSIPPRVSSAGIDEHRNEEEVDHSAAKLLVVAASLSPSLQKVFDARYAACFDVLPSPVGWYGRYSAATVVSLGCVSRWCCK